MTLTELLNSISETKAQMKSKLGTSSNSLNQYPALITNFLYTQYNDGYKAGWKSVKGTSYSGNIRQLQDVPSATVPTSWQGQDTTQLSTLVNVMSGIRQIREDMRDALGLQYYDNLFSEYPNYLTTRGNQEYQTGYEAGVQDATESTPQRVSTPIIRVVQGRDNVRNISSSNATSLRYWTSYTSGGQPIGTATTIVAASLDYQIKQSDDGTYLCAIGMAANMVNSYTASALLSYTGTIPVNPNIIPNVPEVEIDTIENKIYITSEQDVIIKYTTNGGTNWQSNGSNTVTILIRPLGYAAGNLQTYCYFPDNPSNPSSTWTNPTKIEYTLQTEPDEPVEDMSAVPFYINVTNISGTYQIQATQNRFHVSTKTDFSTLVTPTTSATVDKWTLQPNTIYYIKKHFSSTNLPKDGSLELTNYSSGMYVNFGGNLLSLAEFDWENFTPAAGSADTWIGQEAFRAMFDNYKWKSSIKDVSKLYFPPGSYYGYAQMFSGCTNLTNGPSTISCGSRIHTYQFYETFKGCTKLTNAAALTSTSVETSGCQSMYHGCSALTNAGDISATYVGQAAFKDMFYHCTNLVTGPSELKPLTLSESCYYEMFDTCSKLVNAPKILATTISVSQCMKYMFYSCTSLKSINVCFTNWSSTISSTGSTYRWCGGSGVSSSGTFTIEGRGLWNISDHSGPDGIPKGWRPIDNRGIELEPSNPEINI